MESLDELQVLRRSVESGERIDASYEVRMKVELGGVQTLARWLRRAEDCVTDENDKKGVKRLEAVMRNLSTRMNSMKSTAATRTRP